MIHTHTMSQLKTVQEPLKLLRTSTLSHFAVVTAGNLTTEIPTTVLPAPSGPGNSHTFVVISAPSLNYLKLIPFISLATPSGNAIRVTGYSLAETGFYVPQLLFYGTISAVSATSAVINASTPMYVATTINKIDGDAKIYNATSSKSGAFVLIDTLGCQNIKVEFIGAGGGTANAFYGAM
jgi:hypothetical protein